MPSTEIKDALLAVRAVLESVQKSTQELVRGFHQSNRRALELMELVFQSLKDLSNHVAILNPTEIEKHEADKYRKKSHRQQVWLTWGTWLAFIAASIYAFIAHRQLTASENTISEIRRQTCLLEQQTKFLKEQTEINKQQLIGTQAAIVRLFFEIGPDQKLGITLANSGVLAASDANFSLEVIRQKIKGDRQIDTTRQLTHSFGSVMGGKSVEWNFLLPWGPGQGYQQEPKWNSNWPFEETTRISGEFTYFNGFEKKSMTICERWLPAYIIDWKHIGNTSGFADCSIFRATLDSVRKAAEQSQPH